MEKSRTVQITVRISPEARGLVDRYSQGCHGLGVLVDSCIKEALQKRKNEEK
jgi:hypothetical protein